MVTDEQRPKSKYSVFSEQLDLCADTGETDVYPNVNRTPLTPFAPKAYARRKYVAHVDGEVLYAWVAKVGSNILVWSAD